jgi:hypothetical protein
MPFNSRPKPLKSVAVLVFLKKNWGITCVITIDSQETAFFGLVPNAQICIGFVPLR